MTNRAIGILLLLVLLLATASFIFYNRGTRLAAELSQEHSFLAAIQDTARTYKDALGRVVIEKQAAQTQVATLTQNYKLLSRNQKLLATNIISLPSQERKQLVAATEVKQEARIVRIIQVDSLHHWQSHTDTLSYSIRALGDTLSIDSLSIPNQLFLEQHRGKNGAVTVTARNSNPLIQNRDIDSILIPADKKPSPIGKLLLFLAGVAGGILLTR